MPMSKISDKEHPPLPSEAAMTASKRSARTCCETAPSKCSWLSPDRIRLRAPGVFARCSTKPCAGRSSAQIRVKGGQLARPRWPFSPRFTCRAKGERWALRQRAHRAPWVAQCTIGTVPPGQPYRPLAKGKHWYIGAWSLEPKRYGTSPEIAELLKLSDQKPFCRGLILSLSLLPRKQEQKPDRFTWKTDPARPNWFQTTRTITCCFRVFHLLIRLFCRSIRLGACT